MGRTPLADVFDTRIVFRVYAGLAVLAGILLLAGLPMGVTTTLGALAAQKPLFVRLTGALLAAAACVAMGFGQIEDPRDRHHALRWFANGHLVLSTAVLVTAMSHGGLDAGDVGFPVLAGTTVLLFYFYSAGDGHGPGGSTALIDLFARRQPSTEELRSSYEERIRAAAGQEERHRLARDLHDSIKQQIFAMQTAAATAQARFDSDPGGAKEALGRLRDSGREATAEMEAMLESLQSAPLENLGLAEALKKQGEALGFRTGAEVTFEFGTLPPSESLPPGAQHAIFRVAQEALANIARHARAAHVRVSLTSDVSAVVLCVEDDGAGFAPGGPTAASGMGLGNMRARAQAFDGRLDVRGTPGRGTTVTLRVPYRVGDRPDVSDHRRRVVTWSLQSAFVASFAVVQWAFEPDHHLLLTFLALTAASLVGLARSIAAWNRARKSSEATPWTESTSRS